MKFRAPIRPKRLGLIQRANRLYFHFMKLATRGGK